VQYSTFETAVAFSRGVPPLTTRALPRLGPCVRSGLRLAGDRSHARDHALIAAIDR
jgi:hypothetical protein